MYGDGSQTRDFIYVKDIVGALTFVAEHPEVTGVFNAGYGARSPLKNWRRTSSRPRVPPPRCSMLRNAPAT
ncbi:MAG: NAD-dependent epimerase/dehydratase family protein [Akkermansia sp.]